MPTVEWNVDSTERRDLLAWILILPEARRCFAEHLVQLIGLFVRFLYVRDEIPRAPEGCVRPLARFGPATEGESERAEEARYNQR